MKITNIAKAILLLALFFSLSGAVNPALVLDASTGNITFNTSGSSRMILDTNGFLGLNILSPLVTLHVNGTIRTNITSCSGALQTDSSGNIVCGASSLSGGNTTQQMRDAVNITGTYAFNSSGVTCTDCIGGGPLADNLILDTDVSQPSLILDSTSTGDNWVNQGALIALGESASTLTDAALYLTYTGDGFGYIGSGAPTNGIPVRNYWRFSWNTNNIYSPSKVTAGELRIDGNVSIGGNITSVQSITSVMNTVQPRLLLDSDSSGDIWDAQGAYIGLGEAADVLGGAGLYMSYIGDGSSYIGSGGIIRGVPQQASIKFSYNSRDIYTDSRIFLNSTIRTNLTSCAGALQTDSSGNIICGATSLSGGNTTQQMRDAVNVSGQYSFYSSDLICTDCIGTTEISTNAGTDISADLEEETHASEHAGAGLGSSSDSLSVNAGGPIVVTTDYVNLTTCALNEVLKFNSSGMWGCAADSGVGSETDTVATVTARGNFTASGMTIDSDANEITRIGNALFVNGSNGNVGIGTSNPVDMLHISKGDLRLGSNLGGVALKFYPASAGVETYVGDISAPGPASIMKWTTGTDIPIAIMPGGTGKVGIGTTQPNATLHVVGSINVTSGNDICISGGKCLSQVSSGGNTTQQMRDAVNVSGQYSFYSSDLICTDCIGTTEIADSYLLNNGDSATGTYAFDTDTIYIDSSSHTADFGTTSTPNVGAKVNVNGDFYIGSTSEGYLFDINTAGTNTPLVIKKMTSGVIVSPSIMTILNNNRIGIGTEGPARAVDIAGSGVAIGVNNTDKNFAIEMGFPTVAANDPAISIFTTGVNSGRVLQRQNITKNVYIGDIDQNNGSLMFRVNGFDIMKITTDGFAGIGTATPGMRLVVNGSANVTGTLYASNVSSNSPLQLQTAGTTRAYIDDHTGYVGIGTVTPYSNLDVPLDAMTLLYNSSEIFGDATRGDNFYGVEAEDNGSFFYLTGYENYIGAPTYDDIWVVEKRDKSNGSIRWTQTYDSGTGYDTGMHIREAGDYIYIVGPTQYLTYWRFERRLKSTGAVDWATSESMSGFWVNYAYALDMDDTYFYVGGRDSSSNSEIWVNIEKRAKSNGALQGSAYVYNPTGNVDTLYDMVLASDGYLYTAEVTNGGSGNQYCTFEKLNSGNFADVTRVTSDPSSTDDICTGIAQNGSYIYIVGYNSYVGRVEKRRKSDLGLVWAVNTTYANSMQKVKYRDNRLYINGVDGAKTIVEVRDAESGDLIDTYTSAPSGGNYNTYDIDVDDSQVYLAGYETGGSGPARTEVLSKPGYVEFGNVTVAASKLGIGTKAPQAQLHISEKYFNHTVIELENKDDVAGLEMESEFATVGGEAILNLGVNTNRGIVEKTVNATGAWFRVDTRGYNPHFGWFWEPKNSDVESEVASLNASGDFRVNGTIKMGDTGTACDANARGQMKFVTAASGSDDLLYICMKKADNSYAWVLVARGG